MARLLKLRVRAYVSLFIWSTLLSVLIIGSLASTDSLHKVKSIFTSRDYNAAFYSYVLDPNDLEEILTTVKSVEQNYNKYWNYDWVLVYHDKNYSEKTISNLNTNLEKLLSDEIKGKLIIQNLNAKNQPNWFDLKDFEDEKLSDTQLSARLKNRFNTFGMFEMEALKTYDYAINVEIGSTLNCKLKGDIVGFMKKNEMPVAFIDTIEEGANDALIQLFDNSILNLELLKLDNLNSFCSIDSNFQIMELKTFRTFEYLNLKRQFSTKLVKSGWSDHVIKTFYISKFIPKNKIVWLNYNGLKTKLDSDSGRSESCSFNKQFNYNYDCECDRKNGSTDSVDSSGISNWNLTKYFNLFN